LILINSCNRNFFRANSATGPPSFRLITSQTEASQSRSQPFAVNRYPREVFDLSQGQTIAEFAEQFQRELAIAAVNSDEEENDNEDNIVNDINQQSQS